jgi:hypothetical protein
MNHHLYLSLVPEALIASMLDPMEFARYYAVGEHDKPHGQVTFIEIDPEFRHEFFQIDQALTRCVPDESGQPKTSVYISIYRALEHIPIAAMGGLFYVTRDGCSLEAKKAQAAPDEDGLHLYFELAPVRLAVVSTLGPQAFHAFLMGHEKGFPGLPAVAFAEMELGELAKNPVQGDIRDLPYDNIDHLRKCLVEVKDKAIPSKIFDLSGSVGMLYRVVKNGIYVGNNHEPLTLFPMPSIDEQRKFHREWWRSANV